MKIFTVLLVATMASMGVASAARDAIETQTSKTSLKIHVRSRDVEHEVRAAETTPLTHTKGMTAKAFARLAHFKTSPWDGEPEVKASKCADLCSLTGFYSFQEDRNCVIRPNDLCMQSKLGHVAMQTVLFTTECVCDDVESGSADGSDAVEVASDAGN